MAANRLWCKSGSAGNGSRQNYNGSEPFYNSQGDINSLLNISVRIYLLRDQLERIWRRDLLLLIVTSFVIKFSISNYCSSYLEARSVSGTRWSALYLVSPLE
jgi:hypothetical protein